MPVTSRLSTQGPSWLRKGSVHIRKEVENEAIYHNITTGIFHPDQTRSKYRDKVLHSLATLQTVDSLGVNWNREISMIRKISSLAPSILAWAKSLHFAVFTCGILDNLWRFYGIL